MANKKKGSSSKTTKNEKKLTIDDLKKRNLKVKQKNTSPKIKTTSKNNSKNINNESEIRSNELKKAVSAKKNSENSTSKYKTNSSKKIKEDKNKKVTTKVTNNEKKTKAKKNGQHKKVYKSPKEVEKELKLARRKKIISFIVLVCVIILVVELGIFAYLKILKPGTNSYDALNSITLDDTEIIASGSSYFKNSSNYEETNRIEKGRLVKYDKRGKLKFEIQYDRGINSTFASVVACDSGYYVVGSAEFSKNQAEENTRDAILVKYSLDGKKLWEKSYNVLSDTRFNNAILVEDGIVVVGQSIYQNMEMGNHTTGGGIIVKYDFDGNVVWENNHGGNKSGNFNDVVYLDGNYYVVGKDSKDTGVLVKFSSEGKYLFHKNYSYTDNLGFSSIATDGESLYVAGSKKVLTAEEQNDTSSKRNTSNTDALIVKYSLDGNILKEKSFGGSSKERYNSIVYFGSYLYLVGNTSSNDSGMRVSSKNGEITAILVKCDTDLVITRKEVFGGSKDDNMLDLVTDGSNVYMVGYSNSKDSNIITENDNGSDFISKLIKVDYRFRILMKK